jgi:hypothetical protein
MVDGGVLALLFLPDPKRLILTQVIGYGFRVHAIGGFSQRAADPHGLKTARYGPRAASEDPKPADGTDRASMPPEVDMAA